jgi:solute carrier family 25 aspartate/glutamate transporter 12/13
MLDGQEVAGHKLSDVVIERLPTLCTITPGGHISYSEVAAFHNVIRGKPSSWDS